MAEIHGVHSTNTLRKTICHRTPLARIVGCVALLLMMHTFLDPLTLLSSPFPKALPCGNGITCPVSYEDVVFEQPLLIFFAIAG